MLYWQRREGFDKNIHAAGKPAKNLLFPDGKRGGFYREHEKRHILRLEQDKKFLLRFSQHQPNEIVSFLNPYNTYLEEGIEK